MDMFRLVSLFCVGRWKNRSNISHQVHQFCLAIGADRFERRTFRDVSSHVGPPRGRLDPALGFELGQVDGPETVTADDPVVLSQVFFDETLDDVVHFSTSMFFEDGDTELLPYFIRNVDCCLDHRAVRPYLAIQ